MSVTADQQLEEVRRWFVEKKPHLAGADLDLDLDLIENRVLDSLAFVSFIIFLEGLTGREFTPGEFTPATFRTLRTIHEQLLAKVDAG